MIRPRVFVLLYLGYEEAKVAGVFATVEGAQAALPADLCAREYKDYWAGDGVTEAHLNVPEGWAQPRGLADFFIHEIQIEAHEVQA